MLTTARFYDLPVSLTTGEYPLFTSGGPPIHHIVQTVENVKVTKDLDQDLIVPTFEGYETISMVYLYGVGWYWVTGVETSTIYNETLVFHLRYAASTSNLIQSQSVKGIWTRRPTRDTRVKQSISSSPLTATRLRALPTMSATTMATNSATLGSNQIFWIQITSSNYISSSGAVTSGKMTRYGCFAVNWSESNSVGFLAYQSTESVGETIRYAYPTIGDIYNNITAVTGIEASSVVDISVIPICPFDFSEYTWAGDAGEGSYICLLKYGGSKVLPSIGKDVVRKPIVSGGANITYKFRVYNLDYNFTIDSPYDGYAFYPVKRSDSITQTISAAQQNLGSLEIRNWEGNVVGTIPNIRDYVSLSISYISDSSGIYTVINDNTSTSHFILTSAKIPWVGTQWDTYKAYSMDTDRKSIEYAQTQYDKQFQADMANAVFNGVLGAGVAGMGGNVAGAAVGGVASLTSGVVSGVLGREINNMKLAQDQELTEMRMKAAPGVVYSTAYGLNQIALMEQYGGGLYVSMPYGVTTQNIADNAAEFGYPTEGVQTLTLGAGYYKGRILAAEDMTGIIFTRLQEEFNNGLKFKIIYQME